MSNGQISIPVLTGSAFEDPALPLVRIHALAQVHRLPEGINGGINPRLPWSGSRVYKDVSAAMMNEGVPMDNFFHVGSQGMTILTTDAHIHTDGEKRIVIDNDKKCCGIINGRNLYTCALANKDRLLEQESEGANPQILMPIFIMSGSVWLNRKCRLWVSKVNNRGTQMPDVALMNSDGVFDGIKAALRRDGIFKHFGFMANETKIDRQKFYEGFMCVRLLEALDIEKYPIDNPFEQPNSMFSAQYTLINKFWNDPRQYNNSLHLLGDFWRLFETIRAEGYGKLGTRMRPRDIPFVERKNGSKPYQFPITGKESHTRLTVGVSGAVLASFRHFLAQDKGGSYLWAPSFKYVKGVWDRQGAELMKTVLKRIGDGKASDKAKYRALWAELSSQMEQVRVNGRRGRKR
jgi:hypothetical protein